MKKRLIAVTYTSILYFTPAIVIRWVANSPYFAVIWLMLAWILAIPTVIYLDEGLPEKKG